MRPLTALVSLTTLASLALAACDPADAIDPMPDAMPDAIADPLDASDAAAPRDAGADWPDMHPGTRDPFDPIGTLLDAAPPPDAALPDAAVAEEPPLRLRFEAVPHDSGALRLTALAFLPAPAGDFLALDKDGELIHLRLAPDPATGAVRAERQGGVWLDEVYSYSDAGLISVAIDPDFARNRFIYLGFSTDRRTNVIKRYVFDPMNLEGIEATGVEILRIHAPEAPQPWHNVGSIGFTDSGQMWAIFGDKKLSDTAQDPTLPLGALLRFTPSDGAAGGYVVPDDNPFADGSGHPAVYVKGLRSPWTAHYHDGRWFIGDVGQDTTEEVNRVEAPAENFGWPIAEGPCLAGELCAGLVDPWVSWERGGAQPFRREDPQAAPSNRRSVFVGLVYREGLYGAPDPYRGRWRDVITYGDTFVGFVRGARVDAERGDGWHVGHLRYATGWAQAPDGHVYVTSLGTWPEPAEGVDAPLAGIWRAVLDEPAPAP